MARHRGRVIVSKVDANGKKIKGKLATWIKKHPGELYYDSMLEYDVAQYLDEQDVKYTMQNELLLFDTLETTELKKEKITKVKQRAIKYTPDYYLPDYDVYIEVKGYADDLFKLRWKLFKLVGYTGYIVYSLKDFITVLKLLKKSTTTQ